MKEYIHYGSDKLCPELIVPGHSFNPTKPNGLWASPVNSGWGWKEWCESEQWSPENFDWRKHFRFHLAEASKILEIHKEVDILPYLEPKFITEKNCFGLKTDCTDRLNISKLTIEFDGMEVFMSENWEELHYSIFYSWDCDSLVVWNPDVIVL